MPELLQLQPLNHVCATHLYLRNRRSYDYALYLKFLSIKLMLVCTYGREMPVSLYCHPRRKQMKVG